MQPYYCESTNYIPATCQSGRVLESDNLCYFPCLQGFTGNLNFCWESTCGSTSICNHVLCSPNAACTAAETEETTQVKTEIQAIITAKGQFNVENIV